MRHLGSLALSLVLAPVIWLLAGLGLEYYTRRSGFGELSTEAVLGMLILLAAAGLYAILVVTRLSPVGPVLVGTAFLGVGLWVRLHPSSFFEASPGPATNYPAESLALFMAVPLLATVVVPRRWRRYDGPARALPAMAGPYAVPPGFPGAPGYPPAPGHPAAPGHPGPPGYRAAGAPGYGPGAPGYGPGAPGYGPGAPGYGPGAPPAGFPSPAAPNPPMAPSPPMAPNPPMAPSPPMAPTAPMPPVPPLPPAGSGPAGPPASDVAAGEATTVLPPRPPAGPTPPVVAGPPVPTDSTAVLPSPPPSAGGDDVGPGGGADETTRLLDETTRPMPGSPPGSDDPEATRRLQG